MGKAHINIPTDMVAEFCKKNHILKFSLFGSVLRDDFRPDRDVDILVEFEPEHLPGLFSLAGLEIELAKMLGRKVDLKLPGELSRYFRQEVLDSARVQYAKK